MRTIRKYQHGGQHWPPGGSQGEIRQAPDRNYMEDILYALANPMTAIRTSGVGSDAHFPTRGEMMADQQRRGFDPMEFVVGLNPASSAAAITQAVRDADSAGDLAGLLPTIFTRGKVKPAVPAAGLGVAGGAAALSNQARLPEAGQALGPGAQGRQPIPYAPGSPTPHHPVIKDLGASDVVIRHVRDPLVSKGMNERIELIPHDASSAMFGNSRVGSVERIAGQDRYRGQPINVPDISSQENRAKITGMSDTEMAKGVYEMLNSIPNGEYVYASSLSDNSLPIILQNWARGRVSGKIPSDDELLNHMVVNQSHQPLNDYGKEYKNSDEVELWHEQQAIAAVQNGYQPHVFTETDQWGHKFDIDNRFAPTNQMDFDTFVTVDPEAIKLYREGNIRAAQRKYEHYQNQSENDWGVSPMSGFTNMAEHMNLTEMDAQVLADRFNAKLDEAQKARQDQVAKHEARGKKVAADEGIQRATIHQVPGSPGRWEVAYPTPVVIKNWKKGGRIKLKKKRPTGMRVMR